MILAYCLMDNHIHLLIKEGKEPLGIVFKRIGACFVYWYNTKYKRAGHLFQDRFRSEAVENIQYLYTVINYIHLNPVKAGICNYPEDYPYSSFSEYAGAPGMVDMEYVEQHISRQAVLELSRKQADVECLDLADHPPWRLTDQQARQIMKELTGCENVAVFQELVSDERYKCILKLKNTGMSIRQISRLTGMSYYVVQKARRIN